LEVVDDLGVKLVLAANTHAHADHITGSGKLKVKPWQSSPAMIIGADVLCRQLSASKPAAHAKSLVTRPLTAPQDTCRCTSCTTAYGDRYYHSMLLGYVASSNKSEHRVWWRTKQC
jgi:hypothetical protein